LIELIGVLAIMGILASMTVPPILRQIRQAQSGNEEANLNEVARAIVEGIKATGTIPNPNVVANDPAGWFTLAQPYTALSENAFLNVFPENPSTERRYYLDPAFDAYLAGTYTTPPAGFPTAGFPVGALRILIVSSSRGISNPADAAVDPVLPGNAGANLTQLDQLALRNWNKVFAGGVVAVPLLPNNPFSALWTGKGEYLHVKTVDLRPLFCRVTLRDLAAPPTAAVLAGAHSYPKTPLDPVNGTALGYTFDFVPNAGLNNPFAGGEAGILISSLKQRTLIDRTATLTGFDVKDAGSTPLAGKSTFDITLPDAPQYEINNLGIQPFPVVIPPDINSSSFYLIKETVIKLYDGNVVAPPPAAAPTLLLNMPVTTDMNFEYFNGAWTRVD
jgi:type II secretory pathway pseudopilin PulG